MTVFFDGPTERGRLVTIGMNTGESLESVVVPERPFVCGVILSTPRWSSAWLSDLVRRLIERGAVYFAFWGHRCEEAHDIADSVREPFTPAEGDDSKHRT